MPELPEVQTTADYLQKKLKGEKITKIWSDNKKAVKKPPSFKKFKEKLLGTRIKAVTRRAKYLLFHLSGSKTLLAHQRMTGHFLVGKWRKEDSEWVSQQDGAMRDKYNGYLHFIFWLDSGCMLALSDLRKFATLRLYHKKVPCDITKETGIEKLDRLGPEPLTGELDFARFKKAFAKKRSAIKSALMDQEVISGVGNIYSDEILWRAKVNPHTKVPALTEKQFKRIYESLLFVLKKALRLEGTSIVDYRKPDGQKGAYAAERKVYKREADSCPRCGAAIERDKIAGRSTHYCPECQG